MLLLPRPHLRRAQGLQHLSKMSAVTLDLRLLLLLLAVAGAFLTQEGGGGGGHTPGGGNRHGSGGGLSDLDLDTSDLLDFIKDMPDSAMAAAAAASGGGGGSGGRAAAGMFKSRSMGNLMDLSGG